MHSHSPSSCFILSVAVSESLTPIYALLFLTFTTYAPPPLLLPPSFSYPYLPSLAPSFYPFYPAHSQYSFQPTFLLRHAAVSNAGGYHSTKDYFKNEGNDPSIAKISSFSEQAVKIAELHDFQQSQESAKNAMQVDLAKGINLDKLRSFLPSNDQEESWVRAA